LPKLLIGVDAGGTYIKAALFDTTGTELAVYKEPNNNVFLSGGRRERNSELLLKAVYTSIRNLLSSTSTAPSDIGAVAITSYGCGLWLVDEKGTAIRNGIVSTDTRALADLDALDAETTDRIANRVYSRMFSGHTAPLLKWISEHEPQSVARTHRIVACKDFIRGQLCGDFSTDYTDAGLTGLCDIVANDWAYDVLDILDMPEWKDKLTDIGSGAEIVGVITRAAAGLTGLRAGTPVVRGIVDVAACAVASGMTNATQLSVVAGTFSINQTLHDRPRMSTPPLLQGRYVTGSAFLATEGGATSASNLEWCIRHIFRQEAVEAKANNSTIYEECNQIVRTAYAENWQSGMLFFPYFFGGPDGAPAGFLGVEAGDGVKQMMLPVFEGIAFAHKADIEVLISGPDAAAPKVVRMSGGGSNSIIWPQIFADVLELPVEVARCSEMGALGCAVTSAVGLGLYSNFEEAGQEMVKIDRRYKPNEARFDQMRERYIRHQHLTKTLAAAWN